AITRVTRTLPRLEDAAGRNARGLSEFLGDCAGIVGRIVVDDHAFGGEPGGNFERGDTGERLAQAPRTVMGRDGDGDEVGQGGPGRLSVAPGCCRLLLAARTEWQASSSCRATRSPWPALRPARPNLWSRKGRLPAARPRARSRQSQRGASLPARRGAPGG